MFRAVFLVRHRYQLHTPRAQCGNGTVSELQTGDTFCSDDVERQCRSLVSLEAVADAVQLNEVLLTRAIREDIGSVGSTGYLHTSGRGPYELRWCSSSVHIV